MNAREEFLETVKGKVVKCAQIKREIEWRKYAKFNLRDGHTPAQLKRFLVMIDFDYDSGYGGQELFGNIWFDDGTWAERGEYDGSEWWEVKEMPKIPAVLLNNGLDKQ